MRRIKSLTVCCTRKNRNICRMIKMKILILLAFCGISVAENTQTGVLTPTLNRASTTLQDDFNDFYEIIRAAKILDLFIDYLLNDAAMQNAASFLETSEFEKELFYVLSLPNVKNLFNYLAAAGLDIVTWFHNFYGGGLPPIIITKHAAPNPLAEFWDKVKNMLPINELKALYSDKLESSPDFKSFVDKITSDELRNLFRAARTRPEVKALLQRLLEYGIDIKAFVLFVRDLFGW